MEPTENTENQAPMPEPETKKEGGLGPTLSIVLIIILIALGGFYYFTQGVEEYQEGYSDENAEQAVQELQTQGDSDEVAAIEEDLESTDFSEMETLFAELDAELEAQ